MSQFVPTPKVRKIEALLKAAGATDVLYVGGFVRDFVLGIPSKDIDLEIYGLTYRQIAEALRESFRIGQVGQSFSVIKVDNEIDLAIPRRERKIGVGHKAFEVIPDSSMTFREAASRRDFTINAIGMRMDGSFCDPFDGLGDLKRGILRAPTEAFCEDPLRVLRGMQFAARFGFSMEPRTIGFCRRVRDEFNTLSAERLYSEWEKWALKGNWPEKGLDILRETGWIESFPELFAMTRTPQDPLLHPEGNVWEHTRRVCVSAAKLAKTFQLSSEDRLCLMFAALLHDVGKPSTLVKNEDGSISMGSRGKGRENRGSHAQAFAFTGKYLQKSRGSGSRSWISRPPGTFRFSGPSSFRGTQADQYSPLAPARFCRSGRNRFGDSERQSAFYGLVSACGRFGNQRAAAAANSPGT